MSGVLPVWSVQPFGVATTFVESLTSYVRRVASRMLIPAPRLIAAVSGITQAQHYTETINGTELASARITAALAQWSGVVELEMLSFAPFRSGLHLRKDFRRDRAWCPICLAGDPDLAYDQLVSGFHRSRRCIVHGADLQTKCPACGRTHRPFALWSEPTRCHHCGAQLGDGHVQRNDLDPETAAVASIVEWTQQGQQVQPLRIAGAMRLLRAAATLGKMADHLGLTFSTVQNVEAGGQRLQMDTLVRILTRSGSTIAELHSPDPVIPPTPRTARTSVIPRVDVERLREGARHELQLPLSERRSIARLAEDLEVSRITFLRHVPEAATLARERRASRPLSTRPA